MVRTLLFGQARAVQHPAENAVDRWYPLWTLGRTVRIGLRPLLSVGRDFGVYDPAGGVLFLARFSHERRSEAQEAVQDALCAPQAMHRIVEE